MADLEGQPNPESDLEHKLYPAVAMVSMMLSENQTIVKDG